MDRFIGLDAHTQTCTFTVLDTKGKVVRQDVVETNGKSLVEYVKLVPGTLRVCLEEGVQAAWLSELLSPHVAELRVVHGVKARGNKSDAADSQGLAERLRTGQIRTPIYKPPREFLDLRETVRVYNSVTRDVARVKNRVKAFYRGRGISTGGSEIYAAEERANWLKKLPEAMRQAVQFSHEELDYLVELKERVQASMLAKTTKYGIIRILQTAPGLGPIRAAQLLAVVVTPHRFRTSRQFWSYVGFAVQTDSSADWVKHADTFRRKAPRTRGLTRTFNRTLKEVFKGAAKTVVRQMPNEPLTADYQRMVERGLDPSLALVTIARKIAAIVLAMWKKEEVYAPQRYHAEQHA